MEIEKSTTDKSKLVLVIVVIVLVGALFGFVGYFVGSKSNTVIKLEEQIVEVQEIETKKEEIVENGNEDAKKIENIEDVQGETIGWNNYRSEEYGFEIKYPADFNLISGNKKELFTKRIATVSKDFVSSDGKMHSSFGLSIGAIDNLKNLSAKEWYLSEYKIRKEEAEKNNFPFFMSKTGSDTKLNNYTVYKTSDFGIDHSDIHFFISKNNYIYEIHYNDESANDIDWVQHKTIINQILSTFKFTN